MSFSLGCTDPKDVVLIAILSLEGFASCGRSWIPQFLVETDAASRDYPVFAKKD